MSKVIDLSAYREDHHPVPAILPDEVPASDTELLEWATQQAANGDPLPVDVIARLIAMGIDVSTFET